MRSILCMVALLGLAGCAANPQVQGEYVKIRWQVASLKEINEICNENVRKIYQKSAVGCYKRTLDECTIYTSDLKEDPGLHDTLGHEVRHCFVGMFHG